MKPVHKGIGVIGLATGATVLAISILGCTGCSKDENSTDAKKASTSEEGKQTTDQASAGGLNAAVIANDSKKVSVKGSEDEVKQTTDHQSMLSSGNKKEQSTQAVTSLAPPPPGLFQVTSSKSMSDMDKPKAPEMPIAPTNKPIEMEAPKQPEVVTALKAPVAPQTLESKAKAHLLPASAAKAAKTADKAESNVSIPPPPPMPNIETPKSISVPVVTAVPKMEKPEAPTFKKPEMNKPSSDNAGLGKGSQMPSVGNMQMPSMNMPMTSMQMPAMRMPTTSMQMPNMQMPAMNMGRPAVNPNMGYAPRVYYVPVPMYQYAPYGYPSAAQNKKTQANAKSAQSQQPSVEPVKQEQQIKESN